MTKVSPISGLQKDLIKEARVAGLRYTFDDQSGIPGAHHQPAEAPARA